MANHWCFLVIMQAFLVVVPASVMGNDFLVAFLNNPDVASQQQLIIYGQNYVTVSIARTSSIITENILTMGQPLTISINSSLKMSETGTNDKAIRINSPAEITVTAVSTDSYLLVPVAKLGNNYTILAYTDMEYQPEFAVIATQPYTRVIVKFSENYILSFTLEQYESYRYIGDQGQTSMTGAEIFANKPVAVFAGGNKVGKSVGHMAEQLVDAQRWGRTAVVMSASPKQDLVRIVGNGEPTAIRVLGNSTGQYTFYTIAPFSFVEIDIGMEGDDMFLIEANDTMLVGQFSCNDYNKLDRRVRSFTQVLPVETFRDSYYNVLVSATIVSKLHLIRTGQLNILLDANEITEEWKSFQSTQYSVVSVEIHPGIHELTVENGFVNGLSFGVNLYGISQFAAYGQLVDLSLTEQTQGCIETEVVRGDGFDNDCDGLVDEELLDQIDNDNDRKIDEDTKPKVNNMTSSTSSIPLSIISAESVTYGYTQGSTKQASTFNTVPMPYTTETYITTESAGVSTTQINPTSTQPEPDTATSTVQINPTSTQGEPDTATSIVQINPTTSQPGTRTATTAVGGNLAEPTLSNTNGEETEPPPDVTEQPATENGGTVTDDEMTFTTQPSTTSVQPVVKEVKEDPSIGILTIVAPSIVLGFPMLIMAICCIRSILAGPCRKKIFPNQK